MTVDIPIVDDDIVESVENFFANLELLPTDLDITVDPPRTEILIEDFGDGENRVNLRIFLNVNLQL